MLQVATTDNFNPLVPKADNSECQNLSFSLQINTLMPNRYNCTNVLLL